MLLSFCIRNKRMSFVVKKIRNEISLKSLCETIEERRDKVKIGIVADAHGNSTALKSVIGDAKSKGVLDFLTVGDITMKGPSPQECVDLLKKENCLSWGLGNHEILYSKFLKNDSFGLDENREIICHLLNDFDRKNMNEKTYYSLATLPEIKILKIQNLTLYIIHDFQMAVFNSAEFSGADIIICAHTHHQEMSWRSRPDYFKPEKCRDTYI